VIIMETN